jgi:hypothetical protein
MTQDLAALIKQISDSVILPQEAEVLMSLNIDIYRKNATGKRHEPAISISPFYNDAGDPEIVKIDVPFLPQAADIRQRVEYTGNFLIGLYSKGFERDQGQFLALLSLPLPSGAAIRNHSEDYQEILVPERYIISFAQQLIDSYFGHATIEASCSSA